MISSLHGKKVLVPRGKDNARAFSQIVEGYGGVPVEVPLLAFRPVEKEEYLTSVFQSLPTYNWIIFTSDVTVDTFFSILGDHHDTLPKIAAIGEKTEKALREKGVPVSFIPQKYVAEVFAEEFAPHVLPGEKILIPKGNLARDYIAQFFREKGNGVDEIIIYETYFPKDSKERLVDLLKSRSLDVLPFTSPSTINHFMSVVREHTLYDNIKDCIVAAIGPVSKQKCESVGLTVHVMPDIYTSKEMIKAVAEFVCKEVPSQIEL